MMAIRPSTAIIFTSCVIESSWVIHLTWQLCYAVIARVILVIPAKPNNIQQLNGKKKPMPASSIFYGALEQQTAPAHAARWYLISSWCSLVTHQPREHPHDPKISLW